MTVTFREYCQRETLLFKRPLGKIEYVLQLSEIYAYGRSRLTPCQKYRQNVTT